MILPQRSDGINIMIKRERETLLQLFISANGQCTEYVVLF